MRTVSWIATTAIGLVVAGALVAPQALRWLEASAAAPVEVAVPAPRTVVVTAARPLPDRAVRHLPGTIAARVEADLGFRVGGKLSARRVSVGDTVKSGDVVATLDETDLQLQLEAAEAEQVAARIALEKAEISLGRVATLKAKGWATGQASDLETVAVEEARARLLEAGRTVDLARNARSYATLRADADGVVTATLAEPGQVVASGQPVARVAHAGGARGGGGDPRGDAGRGARRGGERRALVRARAGDPGGAAPAVAGGRQRHPDLRGALRPRRGRRGAGARHERDGVARRRRRPGVRSSCRCRRCSTPAPGRRSGWSAPTAGSRRGR